MLEPIHNQTIVDFVGENHELVLTRQVDNLLQHFLWIQRTGRIVRIDEHYGHGTIGDLLTHIVDIRVPVGLLVAQVMHGGAAGEIHTGGPQRVIRRWHKHLIATVEQRGHRQVDELADTIAGVDVFDGDVRNVLELCILHDGLTRGEQALGSRIAFGFRQLLRHVVDDLVRCTEAERCRVANVELQYVGAGLVHAGRLINHWAANIVEHVIKLV